MITLGMAWWYRDYARDQTAEERGQYEFAESEARGPVARRGSGGAVGMSQGTARRIKGYAPQLTKGPTGAQTGCCKLSAQWEPTASSWLS